ncbi:hypothetical protein HDC92_000951 [Pedobacter sp. AK017]|uniref:DUF4397 domain-containing protein n=1 Tax=Pedobacter sp. AK017 TaxID=2723073 RepID=UPI00161CE26C|nr:DUF4397 domain-containing protein [Pedobacter sp. AK017]MBB5437283.1 hypothetical protein [Pedobacter sp. AK017]
MKHIFVLLLMLSICCSSCKKDNFTTTPLASLKIVNTVTGGTPAKLRGVFSTTINNNSNSNFGRLTGTQDLYVYPVADSLRPYYNNNQTISLDAQESYTLFLGGTPVAVTSLFVHENWAQRDNNIRIRFLNFSPGSLAVKVNLATSVDVPEFSDVAFGQLTEFKAYTKAVANSSYQFQVRNATTNVLIASFTMSVENVAAFNNATLVFRGVISGSPAPGISNVIHN